MFILTRLVQLATGKYGALVLAGFLAVQGYFLVRPSAPPLDPPRAEAVAHVAREVADGLGTVAGANWASKYVRVARLQGDRYDYVRAAIEEELPPRTNCRLVEDSLLSEVRDGLAAKLERFGLVSAATADGLQARPVTSLADALELAQRQKLNCVIYGRVEDFRVELGRAYLRVALEVVDAGTRASIFAGTFESADGAVFASAPPETIAEAPRRTALRIAGWLIFILLLPIGTGWFWRKQLERESNFANGMSLMFLTVIDGLLAWMLMGFRLSTVWLWILLLFAAAAAATWNVFILTALERSRERA